jgi:hypothetical protein
MGNPTTICQGADMLRGQKLSSYYSIEPLWTPIFVVTYFVPIFNFKDIGKNNQPKQFEVQPQASVKKYMMCCIHLPT